jgi:hypothetical protein
MCKGKEREEEVEETGETFKRKWEIASIHENSFSTRRHIPEGCGNFISPKVTVFICS